jgi:hypothetical protein
VTESHVAKKLTFMLGSHSLLGSEVLTPVVMKNYTFWDIMQYNPLKFNRRFEEKCRLHLQCRRIRQERKQRNADSSTCYLLHAGFLLGLFFYPEDGGDML